MAQRKLFGHIHEVKIKLFRIGEKLNEFLHTLKCLITVTLYITEKKLMYCNRIGEKLN
jgi:hypothetical protein